jgi:hypothetical protein
LGEINQTLLYGAPYLVATLANLDSDQFTRHDVTPCLQGRTVPWMSVAGFNFHKAANTMVKQTQR